MSPMPSSKDSPKTPKFAFSVQDSDDSSPAPSSPPSTGESLEGFTKNDVPGGGGSAEVSDMPWRMGNEEERGINNRNNGDDDQNSSISRNNLSRTSNPDSLPNQRWRPMRHSGRRLLASNAVGSHSYRSSSNSSGRSSNCDTTEEMYSDVSLEDLSHKLDLLQRQVADLADSQKTVEEQNGTETNEQNRTETKYAALQNRYLMLEEQYRQSELRSEERSAEERKRHRELLARLEREAALRNENCQLKIQTIEIEANALKKDAERLRVLYDRQAKDLNATEENLEVARDSIDDLKQEMEEILLRERKRIEEKKNAEDLMLALSKELERLKSEIGPSLPTTSPEALRLEELHKELDELRHRNKNLEEQNEELLATVLTKGVEECRHVLNGTSNNLAQEFDEMKQAQLEQALKDKEEENERLKYYIDTTLVDIVEKYPQLLQLHAPREPRTPPKQEKT